MSLENIKTIDAAGIEKESNCVVLTIADSWPWHDEQAHLLALQAKLNAYFCFIENEEIWQSYPYAVGRQVVIDIVTRFQMPEAGVRLVEAASAIARELKVEVRTSYLPERDNK